MHNTKTGISSEELKDIVIKGMQEKKAEKIAVLDLQHIKNAVADYFIVCSANSGNHLDAISDSVVDEVIKEHNEKPNHKEGEQDQTWQLLDYVNVVAHIFLKDSREFYSLEDLWGDAHIHFIEDE